MEVPSRISESILNKQTLEWRLPKFKPRFFLYRFLQIGINHELGTYPLEL